jgi:phosphohistidine phosphatase
MRHAKSSWDHPNLDDHERTLSKRGKKNAKKICEFFVKKKYKFDYILLSSSKRTKKTLKILLKKIPKKFKSVLLINHEPTVRNLVRSLTKNHNNNHFKLLNYKFPTSAFAKIYFDFNEWNKLDGNGLIKEFMRPKDLQDSKE